MAVKSARQKLLMRSVFVLGLLIIAGFGASIFSLIKIQFVQGEEYKAKAMLSQLSDRNYDAQRGTIYDRNGKVLAQSANVWKVYINPKRIAAIADTAERKKVRDRLIETLSDILGVDKTKISKLTYLKNSEYAVAKSRVEFEEKDKLATLRGDNDYKLTDEQITERKKDIKYKLYVGIEEDTKRYYPYGNFASAVIGFTGTDGSGSTGIEQYFNSILAGTPGRTLTAENINSDIIPYEFQNVYEAKQGTNLVLTVDQMIQSYLEDALEGVYKDTALNPQGAYGIVMDVKTGAILAMAGKPDYDLNNPYKLTDEKISSAISKIKDEKEKETQFNNAQQSQWRNFAVSYTYEPGSVFKIVTASAAIEEKAWSMSETYTCTGSKTVADRRISCHKHDGHGTQNISQAFVNSCNPFFITVGQRLGAERFFKYFEAFGFTEKSGIDLPNESAPVADGTYHSLASLKKSIVQLSSSSFGQSFEVTPIQVITATAAIANGGKLMRPYIVAQERDENGKTVSVTQPYVRRQVVSETTAKTITGMMGKVVSEGSGRNGGVIGFQVAGKTGTSEKLTKDGAYIASFSCFAPADDAKIAVLIIVDEPTGQVGGSVVAAPVAAEVIENTLKYLDVEPTYSAKELELLNTSAPNMLGKEIDAASSKLKASGFDVRVFGEGKKVIAQVPDVGQSMPKKGIVVLYTEENYKPVKIKIPDLTNLSSTGVYEAALEAGINVKISGSALSSSDAVSYKQSIEPGTQADCGSEVKVFFKSNSVSSEIG